MSNGKGRPRTGPPGTDRIYVNIAADLGRQIRELAQRERRTVTGQLEVLLERGLAATSTNGALAEDPKEAVSC